MDLREIIFSRNTLLLCEEEDQWLKGIEKICIEADVQSLTNDINRTQIVIIPTDSDVHLKSVLSLTTAGCHVGSCPFVKGRRVIVPNNHILVAVNAHIQNPPPEDVFQVMRDAGVVIVADTKFLSHHPLRAGLALMRETLPVESRPRVVGFTRPTSTPSSVVDALYQLIAQCVMLDTDCVVNGISDQSSLWYQAGELFATGAVTIIRESGICLPQFASAELSLQYSTFAATQSSASTPPPITSQQSAAAALRAEILKQVPKPIVIAPEEDMNEAMVVEPSGVMGSDSDDAPSASPRSAEESDNVSLDLNASDSESMVPSRSVFTTIHRKLSPRKPHPPPKPLGEFVTLGDSDSDKERPSSVKPLRGENHRRSRGESGHDDENRENKRRDTHESRVTTPAMSTSTISPMNISGSDTRSSSTPMSVQQRMDSQPSTSTGVFNTDMPDGGVTPTVASVNDLPVQFMDGTVNVDDVDPDKDKPKAPLVCTSEEEEKAFKILLDILEVQPDHMIQLSQIGTEFKERTGKTIRQYLHKHATVFLQQRNFDMVNDKDQPSTQWVSYKGSRKDAPVPKPQPVSWNNPAPPSSWKVPENRESLDAWASKSTDTMRAAPIVSTKLDPPLPYWGAGGSASNTRQVKNAFARFATEEDHPKPLARDPSIRPSFSSSVTSSASSTRPVRTSDPPKASTQGVLAAADQALRMALNPGSLLSLSPTVSLPQVPTNVWSLLASAPTTSIPSTVSVAGSGSTRDPRLANRPPPLPQHVTIGPPPTTTTTTTSISTPPVPDIKEEDDADITAPPLPDPRSLFRARPAQQQQPFSIPAPQVGLRSDGAHPVLATAVLKDEASTAETAPVSQHQPASYITGDDLDEEAALEKWRQQSIEQIGKR